MSRNLSGQGAGALPGYSRPVAGICGWWHRNLMAPRICMTIVLLVGLAPAVHAQDKYVSKTLANMVEEVLASSGVGTVNIPPDYMEKYSFQISQINGRNVCSPEAEADVRRLQQAFDGHPSIYRNFSGYYVSVTNPDGTRKSIDYASVELEGVAKPKCVNLYVEVRPD